MQVNETGEVKITRLIVLFPAIVVLQTVVGVSVYLAQEDKQQQIARFIRGSKVSLSYLEYV